MLGPWAWQLRGSLTVYDATYVALAQMLDAPLVTLAPRLGKGAGPATVVTTPPV